MHDQDDFELTDSPELDAYYEEDGIGEVSASDFGFESFNTEDDDSEYENDGFTSESLEDAEDSDDYSDYVDEDEDAANDDEYESEDYSTDYSKPSVWEAQEFAAASQQQQVALYASQQADLLSREFEEQFGYAPSDEVRFSWMKQAEGQAWNYVQTEQSRRAQFREQVSDHRTKFKQFGYPESAADELVRIVDDCGSTVLDDPYMKLMAVELAIGRAIVRGGGLSSQRQHRSSHSSMEMPTGLGEAKFSRAQSELIESVRRTVYGGRRLSLEEKKRIAGYA